MTYKIMIRYITGDSFGSHEESQNLEAEWTDVTIATENLKRIRDHYEYYRYLEHGNRWQKNKTRPPRPESWAKCNYTKEATKRKPEVVRPPEEDDVHNGCSISIILDNGGEWIFYPFWCGYFERLKSASIELDLPSIEF
jgi:hypothetical protein